MVMDRLQAALVASYRIERELGGGGMSRVFVATERALDRPVVLKVLPPELAQSVSTERFRQEIRLAARLQHPHIVALLAAGEADGLLYYTMPFIEGESLRVRLARAGELPVREGLRVLRDIAAALAYAHEHGVVHRDIKPDNVLISGGEALVTDFGVAKALSASATDGGSGLTSLGVALGTPAYMAPEQAAADPHVDHRADIYAFGCVAYEVLTGQPPFTGRSSAQLLAAHAKDAPETIERRRASLPGALALLVMRCLEKRPADRPQSAGEVLQALEAIATPSGGTEPTQAVPGLSRPRFAPKRGVLLAGGLVALAATAAAATFWTRKAPATAALDADLVAVAPFDALGNGLEIWREGFVDLLSRNLDGAGPLRTVSPTVVIRRWSGRADPSSAATLGRETGAGLAVYGTLVGTGTDSARLSASVLDVSNGRPLGEVQLVGSVHRMDALSDSLTVALLRELGRSRPIVAVRTAGLRSTSLPALKAFLEGERYYRQASWDSAQAAYRRTLALDSAFVPALRHLALSLWWKDGSSTVHAPYMFRAAALNHGLARRDSILVTIDSSLVALTLPGDSIAPDAQRALAKRLFATLGEAVQLYPDDPEAWYAMGEARYHLARFAGATVPEALEAFDRAIALDSAFGAAWIHAIELAVVVHGVGAWDRYREPYISRVKVPEATLSNLGLVDRLLRQGAAPGTAGDSALRAAPASVLLDAIQTTYRLRDSGEAGVRITSEMVSRRAPNRADSLMWSQFHVLNLAYRGHVREAARLLPPLRDMVFVSDLAAELALLGAIPAATADSLFAESLARGPLWATDPPPIGGGPGSMVYAMPWWASRGDTVSLRRFAARVDSASKMSVPAGRLEVFRFMSREIPGYLALARRDTAAALDVFQRLSPDAVAPLTWVTEGMLLARRGQDAEALRLFDRAFPIGWASPIMLVGRLEAGRAAERLGQRERAATAYQAVIDTWRHADPELQPHVEEAKAALARLAGERS
jgi:serine/threonine-protein kinase